MPLRAALQATLRLCQHQARLAGAGGAEAARCCAALPRAWRARLAPARPCGCRAHSASQTLRPPRTAAPADMWQAVEEQLGPLSRAPTVRGRMTPRRARPAAAPSGLSARAGAQVPELQPLVVVVSGPSGVGKDAVIKALQAARPDLHFVVTATSRRAAARSPAQLAPVPATRAS